MSKGIDLGLSEPPNPPVPLDAATCGRAGHVIRGKDGDEKKWWRRRESNPRPQVLYRQFYMRSLAI